MSKKKIVVAFSGGLDTSYTVMRLANEGNEVYRISDDALNKWQVKDSNANLIFNQRGYYDSGNKYEGVPKMGTYEGSKKVNFL